MLVSPQMGPSQGWGSLSAPLLHRDLLRRREQSHFAALTLNMGVFCQDQEEEDQAIASGHCPGTKEVEY